MAQLVPEHLRNNKAISLAHRTVAGALSQGLDASAMVWFEPPFEPAADRHRPDFIVLDPAIGLAVVMVFEQTDEQECLGVLRGELRLVDGGGEVAAVNPIERARPFVESLREELSRYPSLSGAWVEGIAAFPHITRARGESLGFDSAVPLEHCLFQDDLTRVIRGDSSLLPNTLRASLEGGLSDLLTDDQVALIRSIVHPEVRIKGVDRGSLFTNKSDPARHDDVVSVMDLHQEQFAKRLLPGHRVVRGVAGSGKTLVLLTRAKLLARRDPDSAILVTCYTRSLASVLRAHLADYPNVTVRHLDDIAAETLRRADISWPKGRDRGVQYAMALEASAAHPLPRFDSVLVDEAQDFNDDALKMCVAMTEPDDDGMGDLLIVADSAQRIYARNFTWSKAGIHARGRTSVLRHNYRNTRQVLDFARSFVEEDAALGADPLDPHFNAAEPDELSVDDETVIIPPEAADRSGPPPTVAFVDDTAEEIDVVVEGVADWYRPDMAPRTIAVLTKAGSEEERAKRLVGALEDRGLPVFWVTGTRQSKDEAGSTDAPILVSTIHSAKGLEFPKVAICGITQRGRGDDAVRNRSLLYVGLTRSTEDLAIVCHRSSEFAPSFAEAVELVR